MRYACVASSRTTSVVGPRTVRGTMRNDGQLRERRAAFRQVKGVDESTQSAWLLRPIRRRTRVTDEREAIVVLGGEARARLDRLELPASCSVPRSDAGVGLVGFFARQVHEGV